MPERPKQKSLLSGTATTPSLGMVLRGARLGWRWSPKHGGFVRLSVCMDRCAVQLYPLALVPKGVNSEYVCWWDDPGLLDLIAELRHVTRVRRPIYFEVSMNRELV